MSKPEDRYSAIRNIPPRTASGPIVIKATCAEEIRRIPIVNQVRIHPFQIHFGNDSSKKKEHFFFTLLIRNLPLRNCAS